MLHTETVEAETLALIKRLSNDPALKEFVLVGGTALSLQLGHRKSIDIDFFSAKPFHAKAMGDHLKDQYQGSEIQAVGNAVFSRLQGVKVDLVAHQYPWVDPVEEIEGIRMASINEIGAMKMHAIANSGTRLKDFVDMHFLLEKRSLEELTNVYAAKYTDANPSVAKNALLYHDQINSDSRVDLIGPELNWAAVARRLRSAVIHSKKIFPVTRLGDAVNQRTTPLHPQTLDPGTLDLINHLSQDAALKKFVLAGDTALALQLGHRKSADLDFFSTAPFDVRETARYLKDTHNATDLAASRNALHLDIGGIKTSFLSHPYPLAGPVRETNGLRLASLEDIGAMKLNAVVNNGQRLKDFIDIHFLLREKNLGQLLDVYTTKYADASPKTAKRSILYHEDIDFEANVELVGSDLKWAEVVKRLKEAVTYPGRTFNENKRDGARKR